MAIPVVYVSEADERPKIIDADGNEFVLPKTFNVRSEPIARKQALMDVAFAHGARDVSDGKMTTRIVEVSGKLWAETDAEYNSAWDALAAQIIKESFRLEDRGRQINVWKVVDIQHTYPSQASFRYGEVALQLLCLDPFWYATAVRSKEFTISYSPQIIAFEVGGNIEVHPTIEIENLADNVDFALEAVTDGGKSSRIQDSGALNGTTILIDCATGAVTRDGTDIIAAFSGIFPRILGGRENRFEYTGAAACVTFQYREAWL